MDKEAKNELFKEILGNVSKTVEGKLPNELTVGDLSKGKTLSTKDFFNNLNNLYEKNGVYSVAHFQFASDEQVRRNLSRGTAFCVKAMNSMLMETLFKDNIDAYFNDPGNDYTFSKFSAEEKESLKSELKDYIGKTLDVGANSLSEKQFIHELKPGFTVDTYKSGLNCLYNFNTFLDKNRDDDFINKFWNTYDPVNGKFADETQKKIVSVITGSVVELGDEKGWDITKDVREFLVSYKDGENEINPKDFVDHFKNSTLSEEEMNWASDIYRDMIDWGTSSLSIGFEDIMVDGKPMFNEEITHDKELLAMSEVVARALSGEKVTAKDMDSNEHLLSPNIHLSKSEPEKEKSFFDYIADMIDSLLRKMGFNTKAQQKEQEKEQKEQEISEMQDKIQQNRQEYIDKSNERDENDVRRKISFAEISGKSDFSKASNYSTINMKKTKSNDKTVEDNPLFRGFDL